MALSAAAADAMAVAVDVDDRKLAKARDEGAVVIVNARIPAQPGDVTSAGPGHLAPRRFETAGILLFLFPFSLSGLM